MPAEIDPLLVTPAKLLVPLIDNDVPENVDAVIVFVPALYAPPLNANVPADEGN